MLPIPELYEPGPRTCTRGRRHWSHPFGTDRLGRDQLSRAIWASQTTVIVTVATLATGGLVLAVGLGLLSGYVGGWVDTRSCAIGDRLRRPPDDAHADPDQRDAERPQVRSLAADVEELTGIGGIVKSGAPDYFLIFGALSIFSWVGGARIIRSQILVPAGDRVHPRGASRSGRRPCASSFRHLLPNVSNIIIVSLSLGLAGIAGSEIVLTWFGVGIQPPHPSFGALIFDGSSVRTAERAPLPARFPGRDRCRPPLLLQPARRRADRHFYAQGALRPNGPPTRRRVASMPRLVRAASHGMLDAVTFWP